jgi:hypothetical protein
MPAIVLRLEALLAGGVTLAMVVMTVATAFWWAALARSAPWFLAGAPTGSASASLAPNLLAAMSLMLLAAAAAVAGAGRALRGASADRAG